MRAPHLSTGGWIFLSVVVAVSVPTGAWATTTAAHTIIQSGSGANLATVDAENQLLTNVASPKNVITFSNETTAAAECKIFYTPPAGEAIVVTSLTYDIGFGTAGQDTLTRVYSGNCTATVADEDDDPADTYAGAQHVFPIGLPLSAVAVETFTAGGTGTTAYTSISGTGYLIPASQLPAARTPARGTAARTALKPRT